ncbi:Transposase and inactivated derivatives [Bathymodiolus brooksi thiotrophic gill symbiont]|nr:Transposase and inactivated derivatives [Bathymodiolus brooksi thiotrophic gill symbiont]
MSKYIHKSHNVTVLIYHLVFPAKYRRTVIDETVDVVLKEVCLDIEKRDEVKLLEIGTDKDHVHFLVQSVPTYRVTKRVTMIKSLTAREVFKRCPQVKSKLWGG